MQEIIRQRRLARRLLICDIIISAVAMIVLLLYILGCFSREVTKEEYFSQHALAEMVSGLAEFYLYCVAITKLVLFIPQIIFFKLEKYRTSVVFSIVSLFALAVMIICLFGALSEDVKLGEIY